MIRGKVIDQVILTTNAKRVLNEHLPPHPPPTERQEYKAPVAGEGLTLRNPRTGATIPVEHGVVKIAYSVSHTLYPHRLMQYREKAGDKHITDAAVSEFEFGGKAMRLVVVYKADEGGKVYLTTAPAKGKPRKTKKAR